MGNLPGSAQLKPRHGVPYSAIVHEPPHSASSSAMLRCFRYDSNAQCHLLQFLSLADLSLLDRTCRSWRAWLLHPAVMAAQPPWLFTMRSLPSLSRCAWAPQLFTELRQTAESRQHSMPRNTAREIAKADEEDCRLFSGMLTALQRFSRLKTLRLRVCHQQMSSDSSVLLVAAFKALGPSLTTLRVYAVGKQQYRAVTEIMKRIPALRQLQSFSVESNVHSFVKEVPFAPLLQLPALRSFNYCCLTPMHVSLSQATVLGMLPQLTELDCGCWGSDEVDPANRSIESTRAMVTGFLNRRVQQELSAVDEERRISLTYLDLSRTRITSPVWREISQLTSLTDLTPLQWGSDMTEQDWSLLPRFTQLRSFRLSFRAAALPHMLQCRSLANVQLEALTITKQHMTQLASLPALVALTLKTCSLECGGPLSLASKLESLSLQSCSDIRDTAVDWLSFLPLMASLVTLQILRRQPASEAQLIPLLSELQERMPQLQRFVREATRNDFTAEKKIDDGLEREEHAPLLCDLR